MMSKRTKDIPITKYCFFVNLLVTDVIENYFKLLSEAE